MKVMGPLVTENQRAGLYSSSYTVDQRNKNTILFRGHTKVRKNKKIRHICMHDKYTQWCMSL